MSAKALILGSVFTIMGGLSMMTAGYFLQRRTKPPPPPPPPIETKLTIVNEIEQLLIKKKRNTKKIFLFDVDGTLTESRKKITPEMEGLLIMLRKYFLVGIVGGSDMPKQKEQLGENVLDKFDYVFSENGLMAYKGTTSIGKISISNFLGEEKLAEFVKFTLNYLSKIEIPLRRGTFIEFRNGMINISPIGRNCSQKERDDFEKYDIEHKIRSTMIETLKAAFPDYGLTYSIGGQISFDVFPTGWDKTFCLKYLQSDAIEDVYFFGDKTHEGGNDHEIFTHPTVIGIAVKNPSDTCQQIKDLIRKTFI